MSKVLRLASPPDQETMGICNRQRAFVPMTEEEVDSFIQGHEWRFAKTMAHIPHSYVVKKNCRDPQEFERFVTHIRKVGYPQKFGGRRYVYLDREVDGVMYQFWTMGAPLSVTIIINRAVKG